LKITTQVLGTIARAALPTRWYTAIHTIASIRTQRRYLRSMGVDQLTERVWREYGGVVQVGPFAGMRYPHETVGRRHIIPCLLGTYEHQLWPALTLAAGRDPLVVIGAAEGYYAVGLAWKTGRCVHAFEANPMEQRLCRKMARANSVKLSLGSWCTPENLVLLLGGKHGFLLCDIDGGEFSLFTHAVSQALRDSVVVIELHGDRRQNVRIAAGFEATHALERLSHPTDGSGVEMLGFLGNDAPRAAAEYRDPAQQWIVCTPRESPLLSYGTKIHANRVWP
jgi:hypothetical protein